MENKQHSIPDAYLSDGRFKARMPRVKPPEGKAFMIIAVKFANGSRAEHVLELTHDRACKLMGDSIVIPLPREPGELKKEHTLD